MLLARVRYFVCIVSDHDHDAVDAMDTTQLRELVTKAGRAYPATRATMLRNLDRAAAIQG